MRRLRLVSGHVVPPAAAAVAAAKPPQPASPTVSPPSGTEPPDPVDAIDEPRQHEGRCRCPHSACYLAHVILRRSEKVDGETRIREGSLNFRNTQQVATACGTHVPRHCQLTVPPASPRLRLRSLRQLTAAAAFSTGSAAVTQASPRPAQEAMGWSGLDYDPIEQPPMDIEPLMDGETDLLVFGGMQLEVRCCCSWCCCRCCCCCCCCCRCCCCYYVF